MTQRPESLPPPTWMPAGARTLRIDVRRALIPLSLGVLAILYFVLGVSIVAVTVLAILVPALYVAAAVYVRRRAPTFEAEFNRRLQSGDLQGLSALYRDAKLLRLLAPEHWMLSRLGLLLLLRRQYREAEGVLEEAWEMSPRRWRVHLLGPLVQVKHALGEWDDLLVLAEQWRQRALFPGSANLYLAAALLARNPPECGRARELLDEAHGALGASDRALMDALRARVAALESPDAT